MFSGIQEKQLVLPPLPASIETSFTKAIKDNSNITPESLPDNISEILSFLEGDDDYRSHSERIKKSIIERFQEAGERISLSEKWTLNGLIELSDALRKKVTVLEKNLKAVRSFIM